MLVAIKAETSVKHYFFLKNIKWNSNFLLSRKGIIYKYLPYLQGSGAIDYMVYIHKEG